MQRRRDSESRVFELEEILLKQEQELFELRAAALAAREEEISQRESALLASQQQPEGSPRAVAAAWAAREEVVGPNKQVPTPSERAASGILEPILFTPTCSQWLHVSNGDLSHAHAIPVY